MWVYIDVRGNLFQEALTALIDRGQIIVRKSDEDAIVLTDNLIIASQRSRSLLLINNKNDIVVEAIEALKGQLGGIITTEASKEELFLALEAIDKGDKYLPPVLTKSVFNNDKIQVEKPTPREIDVLRFIAQGYTNRQTAEALNISTRTVENHRANLMDKLNLHDRVGLVRYAIENEYVK